MISHFSSAPVEDYICKSRPPPNHSVQIHPTQRKSVHAYKYYRHLESILEMPTFPNLDQHQSPAVQESKFHIKRTIVPNGSSVLIGTDSTEHQAHCTGWGNLSHLITKRPDNPPLWHDKVWMSRNYLNGKSDVWE